MQLEARGWGALRRAPRSAVAALLACCVGACSLAEPAGDARSQGPGELEYEIEYATYFGGPADERPREVIVYPDGSILVGMQAMSRGLPTTRGAFQPEYAGDDPRFGHPGTTGGDLYLLRLDPSGQQILAASYFGGSKQERNVYGMALDAEGNVVVTSSTRSRDLPTTPGVAQRSFGGGGTDWFVAKLSPDLRKLQWSTYLGGGGDDTPRGGLAIDTSGRIVAVGGTASSDFPGLGSAPDSVAVVAWLSADGVLERTRALAGEGGGVALGVQANAAREVYIAGHTRSLDFPVTAGAAQPAKAGGDDNFLMKLSADGEILYATYLGGSGDDFAEHRLALDARGSVYLTGATRSQDFPTTPGAFQTEAAGGTEGFLLALGDEGKTLRWSSYLGGSGDDVWLMPTLDARGRVFVVGQSSSRDFPTTDNALQPQNAGGPADGVLAVLSGDGSTLLYSTYLGGSGEDWIRSFAFGANGEIHLIGRTRSKDFPVTGGALQPRNAGGFDAFIVKLIPRRPAVPNSP